MDGANIWVTSVTVKPLSSYSTRSASTDARSSFPEKRQWRPSRSNAWNQNSEPNIIKIYRRIFTSIRCLLGANSEQIVYSWTSEEGAEEWGLEMGVRLLLLRTNGGTSSLGKAETHCAAWTYRHVEYDPCRSLQAFSARHRRDIEGPR